MVKKCLSRMSWKLSRTVLRRGKGSNPFSLVDYASYDYQELLRANQIAQSMSRKGNCYDNACGESFFASFKKDIILGRKFKTINEAKLEIMDYIESFYNCKRLYSSIGYKLPRQYRQEYFKRLTA